MGVPKFYRWLAERYPLINHSIDEHTVPGFDCFYLDMNGIVHTCSHPEEESAKPKNEADMMAKICAYLDRLFQVVKPQRVCFMAIDGCAPRAKMNQQRARRFRAAQERKEMEDKERMMALNDEDYEAKEVFDSNCITPGTKFMVRLSKNLKFFIQKKVSEDPVWQVPDIIFSGHEVPGEGEHKLMDYIRQEKSQPDYPPNLRHCIYGLDADLIMLSLLSHEPHFALLREVVTFGAPRGAKSKADKLHKKDSFQLLYVAILREYFDMEFSHAVKDKLSFEYDVERIIDDFVFMCYLVGNDFLPPLPTIDIRDGGLDDLIATYKEMLPTWTGYLVENMGPHINVERFEKLLARISESERAVLMEKEEDIKFMKSKAAGGGRGGGRGRGRGRSAPPPAPTQDELDEADAMDRAIAEMSLGDGSDPVKNRYYFRKLGAEFSDPDLETMKRKYLEGMNWVLGYYYQGCQSWNWFYPYHYAPLASDMVNLEALGDTSAFVLGKPFLPFQQLLGVLPPLSSALLPVPYRSLMTNPASPVFEFFNQELKLDMEGKSFEWEAIVLLPFMVEAKLMSAVDMVRPEQLSEEERKQNILGSDYIFSYDPSIVNAAKSPIPNVLADIPTASCRIEPFCMKPFPPGQTRFIPKLCEGVSTGRNCVPGWPTTGCHFLGLDGKLAEIGVNVFGRPSKRESVLVTLGNQLAPGVDPKLETTPDCWSAEELVTKAGILGKSRWANFPFLIECKVVAVCDGEKKYTSPSPSRPPNERVLQSAEAEQWQRESSALGANHRLRWGLDPGPVTCTVDVRLFTGVKRASKGLGTEKVFSSDVTTLPFQLTLARPPQEDPRFQTISDAAPIEHHFPVDSKVLYVEPPLNGVPATVAGAEGGKIEIAFEHTQGKIPDTFPQTVIKSLKPTLYFPLDFVAKKLKLEYSVVSRVLSVVPLRGERNPETGRWDDGPDIGLQLKFEKRNLCMPGFTQRPPTGRGWQCSVLLVQILQAYNEQFPEVFKALGASSSGGGRGRSGGGRSGGRGRGGGRGGGRRGGDDDFELDPKKIFAGQDPIAKVSQVMKFLGNLPTAKLPLVPATARCYDTVQIAAIEKGGDDFTAANKASKAQSVTRKVSAKALVRPTLVGAHGLGLHGHAGSWELGNRVVNAKNTGTVPFGLRGTVVGFSADNSEVEVVFDRPFLGGDALRGRCSDLRGKQLPVAQLWRLPVRGAPVRPQSAAAAPLGSTPRAAAAAADPAKGSSGSRGRGRDTGKAPAPARQQQVDRLQKLEALEQQRMVQAQQAQQQHQLLLLQQQQAMMQQQMAMQGTDQQQRLAHLQQQEQQRLAASQAQPAQSELPVPAPVVTAQPPSAPAPAVSSLQAQANDLTAARFISGAAAVAAAPATRSIPLTDLFGSAVAKAQEAPAPLPAPDP